MAWRDAAIGEDADGRGFTPTLLQDQLTRTNLREYVANVTQKQDTSAVQANV